MIEYILLGVMGILVYVSIHLVDSEKPLKFQKLTWLKLALLLFVFMLLPDVFVTAGNMVTLKYGTGAVAGNMSWYFMRLGTYTAVFSIMLGLGIVATIMWILSEETVEDVTEDVDQDFEAPYKELEQDWTKEFKGW